MRDNMAHSDWANIIADAIECNWTRCMEGDLKSLSFVDDMVRQDALLNDPHCLREVGLSAAWGYADAFFDAASPRSPTLDGISWEKAKQLLLETAHAIRAGASITDERVLRYSYL